MLLAPKVRLTAKAGNRPDECEDAFRVVYNGSLGQTPSKGARIALSDGASEAAFARSWAQILVREFVERPPEGVGVDPDYFEEWLTPSQAAWHQSVPWDRIPWHGEAKTRAGSLATLLGLCFFRPDGSGRNLVWTAAAVGDSCLFLVRNNALAVSFPLQDPGEFNNVPSLLCSNPAGNGQVRDRTLTLAGSCQPGDIFILASDALSCWFLEKSSAGENPWDVLLGLNQRDWDAWVDEQRSARLMRNDDTALVTIEVR